MKKLLLVLCLLLIPSLIFATENVGYETQGASSYNINGASAWAFKLLDTPSTDGTVDSITFTVDGNDAERLFKLALYTDASGMPGSLVANSVTVEGSVTGTAATDKTLAIASGTCSITAGTTYWIVIQAKTDVYLDMYYDDAGTGRDGSVKAMTYGNWSSWGGTEDGNVTWRAGKGYFTYTATAATPAVTHRNCIIYNNIQ